jgi:hypothetical protein
MTEAIDERVKRQLDLQLDRELQDTFPASDPLTITRFRREQRKVEKPQMRSDASGALSDSSRKMRYQHKPPR